MRHNKPFQEVVVSHLPATVDEDELRKLFSLCGSVRAIKFLSDANGQLYGKAFVRMANAAEAREAVQTLDGARLHNRCISVSPPRQEVAAPQPPAKEDKSKKSRAPRRKPR